MSSGFISEAELAEQRKLRQEEWERVRTAEQPTEAPEEQYDPRSLFERLQEQKNKRDIEYEEAHKLKNMIKGLDDDEVEFLDLVDRTKLEEERKKNLEEEKEMRDFKAAVASLQEKTLDTRLKQELKNTQTVNKNVSSGSGRSSQLRLLAGAVVKKAGQYIKKIKQRRCYNKRKSYTGNDVRGTKRKLSETEEHSEGSHIKSPDCSSNKGSRGNIEDETPGGTKRKIDEISNVNDQRHTGGMKCIGILPGLGSYQDSSDSDCSSDTDQEPEPNQSKYDLLGRKIECPKDKEKS